MARQDAATAEWYSLLFHNTRNGEPLVASSQPPFPSFTHYMTRDTAAVLVFARAPRRGEVKTRLAAEIGDAEALEVYRALAERVIGSVRRVSPGIKQVHYTPEDAESELRGWLGANLDYVPQVTGDLGRRMEAAFAHAFAAGGDRVIVVGSDIPDLTTELMEDAFEALRSADAVLGPARDGGFYLLGLRAPAPRLFHGIDWGTDQVLAQTTAGLRRLGILPELLESLSDVDRAADLPADWRSRFGEGPRDLR